MSTDNATHADGHEQELEFPVHATFRGYLTGFLLSVVLTAVPFWLVMGNVLDNSAAIIAIIVALGAIQIFVHMLFFLHIDAKGEEGWNLLSLLFSGMLVVIMLVGSLWIMHHLHENTMPAHPSELRTMP